MRYLCLAAIFLALPLTGAAQERRAVARRPAEQQSEQRQAQQRQPERQQSETRQSETRQSPQRNDDSRQRGQSRSTAQSPSWEQHQSPWWERQGPPSWEQPTNSRFTVPLPNWATTLNGRALMDRDKQIQQNAQRPGQWQNGVTRRGNGRRQYQPMAVYLLPDYRYFSNSIPTTNQFYVTPPPPTSVTPGVPEPPVVPLGALRLEVEPRALLQIFVDGAYVGTPTDVDDEVELTPGTRRIELRAPGYKTLVFNTEIIQDRMITYRGALERVEPAQQAQHAEQAKPAPPAALPPPGPTTMYVIPGCYLGNVLPKQSDLRSGCDISKLTTFPR